MNQKEWLEYRRSLGLPADPEKDFPPGYRKDPSLSTGPDVVRNTDTSPRQRRRTEKQQARPQRPSRPSPKPSGRGAAPGTGGSSGSTARPKPRPSPGLGSVFTGTTSGQRKQAKKTFGSLISFIVILVMIFGVGRPLLSSILDSSSSSTSPLVKNRTSPWETRQKEKKVASAEVTKQSENLMKLFAAGDSQAVSDLVDAPPSSDARLLTPEQARRAMGPDPRWKHLSTEVNFGTATVTGTLTTEAGDVPVRLRMTESEGEWKPEPLHVPRIHVPGEGLPKNTEVNGQKVNLGSKTLVTDLLVWPGTLTVVLPKDKFTTYSQRKSTEQLTQQVSSIGIGQRVTVDVNAERTSEFSKQAEKAAVARVKTCLRSTVLEPKNCPFGGTVSDSVSKVADVHYTQTAPFTRWKLTGSPGTESIWGTGGRIVVAATGVTTTAQGTKVPTRISGSWETLVGDVAVRSGKVVFTSH